MLLTCNETIFESVLWNISSGWRWSSHSCRCEKLLTPNDGPNLCYLTTEHASDFSSWSQSCLHCSYTCSLLHSSPLTLAPRLVGPLGFLPWLVHPFLAFCFWSFLVNLMCLQTCAENLLCDFALTNTLVLLIEKRAPLKKLASETTYFELLVLAFRVFGLLSSWRGCWKLTFSLEAKKNLNPVSQVTETSEITQCWEAVQFESDIMAYLWNGCGSRQAAVVV